MPDTPYMVSGVPRITSHALAMRPESRRILGLAAVAAVSIATTLGYGVAYVGDILIHAGDADPTRAAVWGGLGAFVAALLGVSVIPVVRRILISRQDVRLIEAASPLHPLIKRLMIEAPGTYAHSLAVASLAEAGAEAVGADALVARVGAYYHDVGKLRRPCYFFENLADGENPHDLAKPSLSALIITAHVADGLQLAEEYDLPPRICDIIRQHHGTSLVRYFFYKAAEDGHDVAESDFRYHGGNPTTKEAALVMIADGSEAAVRALKNPDATSIATAVRFVVDDKERDGQLELAGFADGEVDTIVETFARMLANMLHTRCEYPQTFSAPRKEAHADQRREPSRA
jgi:putative nucleotidyltransferase with HDIG domain